MSKIIISDGQCIKPGLVPEFYTRMTNPEHKPMNLYEVTAYSYTYELGRPPRRDEGELLAVITAARASIWQPEHRNLSEESKRGYAEYVEKRFAEAEITVPGANTILQEALDIIVMKPLPAVRNVHGDMTLENILITPDCRIVFIDPGEPRKMYTPALDRGKLLQSYCMGWEHRAWIHKVGLFRPPSWTTEIDWAFLVTHWTRLYRHWKQMKTELDAGWEALDHLRSLLTSTAQSANTQPITAGTPTWNSCQESEKSLKNGGIAASQSSSSPDDRAVCEPIPKPNSSGVASTTTKSSSTLAAGDGC